MNRAEWLKLRKSCIGASDVAAVLRIPGAHRGPLAVYTDKVTEEISDYDNKAMRVGRIIEGAIANEYEIETGRPVDNLGATVIQKHSDYPFIGSTLDRVTAESFGDPMVPLELKSVARHDCTPDQWEMEPPLAYQAQLQIQMFCTGATWGSLAGMFMGYKLAYKDIEFNPNFIDAALPILEAFWKRVENREPPPVENGDDLGAIKQIWKKDKRQFVSLPYSSDEIVRKWEKAKYDIKAAEQNADFYEAQLRELMKDSTDGQLPDGSVLTLKTTKRGGFTVEPTEFRVLRHKKGI